MFPLKGSPWTTDGRFFFCSGGAGACRCSCYDLVRCSEHCGLSMCGPPPCNEHTRFSLVSHGASPRFCCGFTQASYMGPERAKNLRAETSAGPGDLCDHTAPGGVHPWLRPLVSVGEWVFLRLFSSLGFPTISSQNSPSSTEDCHCSVR